MHEELETVILRRSVPEVALESGDLGTIVHRYSNAGHYEVEFLAVSGDSLAVVHLSDDDIRGLEDDDILCSRKAFVRRSEGISEGLSGT